MKQFLRLVALVAVCISGSLWAATSPAKTTYLLKSSTLTYSAHHPLHAFTARSKNAAKGKAVCDAEKCELLIAVPVKSFDSENSNRDAHMLEVSRGAEFPLITFRSTFALKSISSEVDGVAEFAGQTKPIKLVKLKQGGDAENPSLSAETYFLLKDFNIDAPALLGVSMSQDIAVTIEAVFTKQ